MKSKNIYFYLAIALALGLYFLVRHFYFLPKYDNGEKAPNFTGTTPEGQVFQLSELEGNVVLLDFWGSWCGPCLREIPELVALYEQYNREQYQSVKGFTIVSVAVENDRERWERALDRFNMPWTLQAVDLATSLRFFDSPIAGLYGVKQLPSKFLIDEKGNIVLVNPGIEEIKNFLEQKK